jgi:hypothetical protein
VWMVLVLLKKNWKKESCTHEVLNEVYLYKFFTNERNFAWWI